MFSLDIVTIVEAHSFVGLPLVGQPAFSLPDNVFSELA